MTAENVEVIGPVVDQETGMQTYTVRAQHGQAEFGIVPVEEDGVVRWLMRPEGAIAFPTDPGFELYSTAEEAYDAGVRASAGSLGL